MYALKMTKDVSALKAVSQNLMHENLSTTDGVYWVLSEVAGHAGNDGSADTDKILFS